MQKFAVSLYAPVSNTPDEVAAQVHTRMSAGSKSGKPVVACRASHFIELPCQTSFCLFLHFFISLLSVA